MLKLIWCILIMLVPGLVLASTQGTPLPAKTELRLMLPVSHIGGVTALAVRPDAVIVATGGYDQRIQIWHLPSARQWRSLAGHSSEIRTLEFSPNGAMLASGDGSGSVRVWRLADGISLCSWKPVDDRFLILPSNPPTMRVGWDGNNTVWAVGQNGLAHQWRVKDCTETAHTSLHDSTTWDALQELDGWTIATQNTVLRLDTRGKVLWRLQLDIYPVSLHRHAGNEAVLLSDGRIIEFDLHGHIINTPPVRIDNSSCISLTSLEEGWIATSGSRVLTHLLSGKSENISPLDLPENNATPSLLSFDKAAVANHKIIAAGGTGLVVLDARSFTLNQKMEVLPGKNFSVLATSAASGRMLIGDVLWSLSSGRPLGTLHLPNEFFLMKAARFSTDGHSLLIIAESTGVRPKTALLNYALDSGLFLPAAALPDSSFDLALDSTGGRTMVATQEGILAFRTTDLAPLGKIGGLSYAEHVDIESSGTRLLAANSNEAELIDLTNGQVLKRWDAGFATRQAVGGLIQDVRIGQRGESMWFATAEGVVAFDANGVRRWHTTLPPDYRRRLALAPGERTLLAAGEFAARLDAQSGEVTVLTQPVAAQNISWVDSRNALMLGADGAVRLWKSDTRPLLEWRTLDYANQATCFNQVGLCGEPPPWIVTSGDGHFDLADFDAFQQLVWYDRRDPYRPLQLEWFARKAFSPRLLGRTLAQGLPPSQPITGRLVSPPKIRIVDVASVSGDPKQLRVDVEVEAGSATLGGVKLYRDGVRVARIPATALVRNGHIYKARIEPVRVRDILLYEPIRLEAIAFDSEGINSSPSRRNYLVHEDPATRWNPPRTWLINIGVNRYQNSAFDLSFAANDARRLGDTLAPLLSRNGAEQVVRVPLIADTDPAAASKARIREALLILSGKLPRSADSSLAMLGRAGPSDTVLISFSGHGALGADNEFYLLPGDIGSGNRRVITPELLARSISSRELAQWLEGLDAGQVILLLDACYAAAAVNENGFIPGPMDSAGLGQLAYDKGFAVLVATQADDVALESGQLKQGLLTYALTNDGLDSKAADFSPRDGRIGRIEWLRYGVSRVPDLARSLRSGSQFSVSNGRSVKLVEPEAGPPAAQTPALFYFPRGRLDENLLVLPR